MPLCTCQECIQHQEVEAKTGNILRGRMLGNPEWKEHRSQTHARFTTTALYEQEASIATVTGSKAPTTNTWRTSSPSLQPKTRDARQPDVHVPLATSVPAKSEALFMRLSSLKDKITRTQLQNLMANSQLVFRAPPTRESSPMTVPEEEKLQLHHAIEANTKVVEYETWLLSALDMIPEWITTTDMAPSLSKEYMAVESKVKEELDTLVKMKMMYWEKQRMDACHLSAKIKRINSAPYVSKPFASLHPTILACYLLGAVMYLICGVSQTDCHFLLSTLRIILRLCSTNSSDLSLVGAHHDLPQTIDTLISHMNLEPKTRTYVSCPKCCQIYPLHPERPSGYPQRCTYKSTLKSAPCNAKLGMVTINQKEETLMKPVRLFLHHELEDWIAELHSKYETEILLDRDIGDEKGQDDATWDIWDSPELREFLGPEKDPQKPFQQRPGNEGRLIFSLNMDGFNPFSNKESSKKVTTGAIYLVCLNFPPAVRYDLERMFLACIIPGPDEPSKEQINHVLRPLVDDLIVLWEHGFFLTTTPKYPLGRLIRGAVIPVICDLPAARQMAGFAGHASNNFCSFCLLPAANIDTFDYGTWKSRTNEEHRKIAEEWRDARSQKERDVLFAESGVRWSELLRLPYWDPTRFLMIDSMHGFLLRLFQRHCRQIWGMNVDFEDGDMPSLAHEKNLPSDEEMRNADMTFRYKQEDELRKLTRNVLKELARSTGTLPYGGSKKTLVKNLLSYRIDKSWFNEDGDLLIGKGASENPQPSPVQPAAPMPKMLGPKVRKLKRARDDPPTEQEIVEGLKTLEVGTMKRIGQLRKALLMKLCTLKEIQFDTVRCTVQMLAESLNEWRVQNEIIDSSGNILDPEKAKKRRGKRKQVGVLGQDTLKEVREDMEKLSLPSWVSRPPRQPGVAKRGKFTADQWRTFCTINLVITLTRLWGTEPEKSRKRLMLDNFLHLVAAVKIASMRSMTPERIKKYTFHMHQYLTGLQDLYPGTSFTPYQHLALHFQFFLERFGPVHAWRCFPFEHYNYLLQKIPTNMKFGELEKTMLKRFCMGQKLRSLLKLEELPSELEELVAIWEKNYEANIRGTLLSDSFTFDESFRQLEEKVTWGNHQLESLPDELFQNLKNWIKKHDSDCLLSMLSNRVYRRSAITRLGETYQISSSSVHNSRVYYRDTQGHICAGSISGIFSHTRQQRHNSSRLQTFFIVDQYKPLPQHIAPYDHYGRNPHVSGKLYSDSFFYGPTVISSDDLLYYFASIPIKLYQADFLCLLALPLDRS